MSNQVRKAKSAQSQCGQGPHLLLGLRGMGRVRSLTVEKEKPREKEIPSQRLLA